MARSKKERLLEVEKARKALQAKEDELRKSLRADERKKDTRRKILQGAVFEELMMGRTPIPATPEGLRQLLMSKLERPIDQALYDQEYWAERPLPSSGPPRRKRVGVEETATRSEPLSSQPHPIQAKRQE